jgi:hypothetical protein
VEGFVLTMGGTIASEMKTNKKIIWLVCIVSAFAVLLTAYIMPFLEKALVSLKIEENAMLRAFSIEFIIRPVIASVISIFMFYLGLIFLRRLGIYTESSTLRWYDLRGDLQKDN